MKETGKKVNNQTFYSSELEEYSFTVEKGKNTANVIVKLDIKPEDDISEENIAKGLVQYLSVFEEIMTWQCENDDAMIQYNGE